MQRYKQHHPRDEEDVLSSRRKPFQYRSRSREQVERSKRGLRRSRILRDLFDEAREVDWSSRPGFRLAAEWVLAELVAADGTLAEKHAPRLRHLRVTLEGTTQRDHV